jgi:hypothetical protein
MAKWKIVAGSPKKSSVEMIEAKLTIVGNFGSSASTEDLEETDRTSESVSLLGVVHVAHLVG